jgi:hypothetical protein
MAIGDIENLGKDRKSNASTRQTGEGMPLERRPSFDPPPSVRAGEPNDPALEIHPISPPQRGETAHHGRNKKMKMCSIPKMPKKSSSLPQPGANDSEPIVEMPIMRARGKIRFILPPGKELELLARYEARKRDEIACAAIMATRKPRDETDEFPRPIKPLALTTDFSQNWRLPASFLQFKLDIEEEDGEKEEEVVQVNEDEK